MKSITKILFVGFIGLIALNVSGAPSIPNGLEVSHQDFSIPIRVLLDKGVTTAIVRPQIGDLYARKRGFATWKKIGKKAVLNTLKIKGVARLSINGTPYRSTQVELRSRFPEDSIHYRGIAYRGTIHIHFTKDKFILTNVIPLEQYLMGTLEGEMYGDWPVEALKAQAVAARTYALYMRKNPKHRHYDIQKSTQDQVYIGAGRRAKNVLTAIQATQGQYMLMNRKIFKSYYHSRCGGKTDRPETVWRTKKGKRLSSVGCPYCQKNPYRWKASFQTNQFLSLLKLPQRTQPKLHSIRRTPSGRILSLKVAADKQVKTLSGEKLRALLGYSKVKSSQFDWETTAHTIQFNGTGAGHGVGMCQWGAWHLATLGKSFKQIIQHYYPGTKIGNL